MRCLVLGGGGFLGSHLCDGLLEEGHVVGIFDRPDLHQPENISNWDRVEWLEGDFVDREDVARAISGYEIVYHLISSTLPQSSNHDPIYDVESNVVATLHLLELAKKENVRKLIFVSSGGTVYGIPKEIPIKETHPTDPISSYGICKLAIEKFLHLYHLLHGMNYCILRIANIYGERQEGSGIQSAVAVFLHKALRNKEIDIFGDGTVIRDFIYVRDAVKALLKAKSFQGPCGLFNIGAGCGKSLNEVASAIESLLGLPVKRKYLSRRPFDVPTNILDISKAAEVLCWRPEVSFQEGLWHTWQWMRERLNV